MSLYLNAPAIYVFLKMFILKVIHFIFETSKTVEITRLFTTMQIKS